MLGSRRFVVVAALLAALLLLLTPRAGRAQSIAGSVRDATRALLPGVTVEAASPALIERVRTAVTDGQGNYLIVDLRPGTYSVTFTLPGFNTFVRDGIELPAGFTATVHAELTVGAVEETVTVTGASPVVDVQNVRTQRTLTQEVLESVPTSRSYMAIGALTLGASGGSGSYFSSSGDRDVGGNTLEGVLSLRIHGSRMDGGWNIEGMKGNPSNTGVARRWMVNQDAVQEVVADTDGQTAETETGGISVNIILREGSNSFHGMAETEYTGEGLQSANLDDELRARGIFAGNEIKHIYSAGFGFGGAIRRDRVWLYSSYRDYGTEEGQAGIFYNKPELQHTLRYEPDLSRPATRAAWVRDTTTRVTWQATPTQKVSGIFSLQGWCSCRRGMGPTKPPENTADVVTYPIFHSQVNWSHPRTNRLLFEAGFSARWDSLEPRHQPEVSPSDIAVRELSTGINFGPWVDRPTGDGKMKVFNSMFSTKYVTGSHALNVGVQAFSGVNFADNSILNNDFPVQYILRNGVPVSLLQVISPANYHTNLNVNLGVFAQEQWTMRRVTLNLGVRFDYLNASSPPSTLPPSFFFPALEFPGDENLPNWKDITPRLGVAWDLTGTGRTALKAFVGRYVVSDATGIAKARNPQAALATSTTRIWNDANGNLAPDCELANNAVNGECGAVDNRLFGTTRFTRDYDPDYLNGWGKRTYNWQTNVTLAHELGRGVSVSVGYFRRWYGNLVVTENVAVGPDDFTPYSITAPLDPRLPGGGGYELTGLFDINPDAFGLVQSLVHVDNGRSETFSGVDFAVNARFDNGALLNAGVALGKTTFNNLGDAAVHNCGVRGAPTQSRLFCVQGNRQDQVKINASYPLPWGLQVAAVYQNIPGNNILANLVLTNAQVAPALGRNLGRCRGAAVCNATVRVPIISPASEREGRGSQLDLRFTKTFRVGDSTTIRPGLDIYNLFNANDVVSSVSTYGRAWLRPGAILVGRLFKFNVLVDF